jgi:glycosyltransferase involved in cell wall biosynthesis
MDLAGTEAALGMNIYVNGRFRMNKLTGVQRVAQEITCRLPNSVKVCQPRQKMAGWKSHLWEQTSLARQSRDGVLWSPCASGPMIANKHIVTFHDLFPLESPQWYSKSYASWYRFSWSRLASRATHIIAVSEYTKIRLVERLGVDPEKVTVIHNGVDHKLFSASHAAVPAARAELKLPLGRYLLCVGSLEPRKNLTRLISAWTQVSAELPTDVWLVVAGSSEAIYGSADFGELPPRVFLTGYVPERHLQGLYAGSLGFVYPSLAEGFGLPPLEAMACGIPVMTSRTGALPEVCCSAALYFDPTNTADLSRAMKLLVSDVSMRRRLSFLGRERAAALTWERTAERTFRVLTNMTNEN